MSETLLHYSKEPLTVVRSVKQSKEPRMKPLGLWVSVQGPDDWASWCEGEQFNLESFANAFEIKLRDDANILRLKTDCEIVDFGRQFDVPGVPHWRIELDWAKVAAQYQGIIIAPYSWECRYHDETSWYYGWDCASGCIWDAAAVADIIQMQQAA